MASFTERLEAIKFLCKKYNIENFEVFLDILGKNITNFEKLEVEIKKLKESLPKNENT